MNGETRVDLAYSVTDSAGKDLLTLNGKDLAHRLAEIPHTREAALRYLETREPSLEIWIVDLIETCGVVLRSSLSDAAKKHFVHIHSYPFLLEDGINTQIIPSLVERAQMRASDLLEGITRRQL